MSINAENTDLMMSKHSTADTNPKKEGGTEVLFTGDTCTRQAAVVYDKRYDLGGGEEGGYVLSER